MPAVVQGLIPRPLDWLSQLADLVTPPHCAYCGDSNAGVSIRGAHTIRFCEPCLGRFEPLLYPCPRCAAPRPYLAAESTGNSVVGKPLGENSFDEKSDAETAECPRCRQRRYRFARVVAGGAYRGCLRHAVVQLKGAGRAELGAVLGQWLATRWSEEFASTARPDYVAPVPSHWHRRWSRGYNPAEEIARPVARILRIALGERMLRVTKRPKKQGTLTPNQRFDNVRGLFRVSRGYDLAGKRLLLVDDVLTTGATANEAARVLRRAGAARVDVLVAARGVGA